MTKNNNNNNNRKQSMWWNGIVLSLACIVMIGSEGCLGFITPTSWNQAKKRGRNEDYSAVWGSVTKNVRKEKRNESAIMNNDILIGRLGDLCSLKCQRNNNKQDSWRMSSHEEGSISKCLTSTMASLAILFASFGGPITETSSIHDNNMMWRNVQVQPVWAAESIAPDETALEKDTVLDEVWRLVNKFYIDPTYHGQNWDDVRGKFESQLKVTPSSDGSSVDYDDDQAMKLAVSMVGSLGDKYSRILDRTQYEQIQKFDLIGVGATLMPDTTTSDKKIMVGAPPVKGSSADKMGVQVGDVITAVNGVPTAGRTAFDIIDQIQPDAPTVTMTVLRPSTKQVRDVTMARQFVQVKDPITYRVSERRPDGTVVGYIRIREFNSLVRTKLEEALTTLENKEGCNAYVLDIRSNPGGAFQSAVEISSLFMSDVVATSVLDSHEVKMPFRTAKDQTIVDPTHPIAIWLDNRSASATEVLAGSLHDRCRAVTMGTTNSFGKGLIQAVYGLKNGAGLVLTVAKYVTPKDIEIQGIGIPPDIQTNLPSLLIPPTFGADTTNIDFTQVQNTLHMCQPPQS